MGDQVTFITEGKKKDVEGDFGLKRR